MLMFCAVNDEYAFFEKVWRLLAADIQYRMRDIVCHAGYQVSDVDLKNYLLDDLFSKTALEYVTTICLRRP